jgi:mRNA interferase MazF
VRRGDIVTVALQGDQGKPRPALVIQSDLFTDLPAISLLPITDTLIDATIFRVPIQATAQNGLAKNSQIMVDKPQTPLRSKIGSVIGRLDDVTLLTVNRALTVFLGLA